MVNLFESAYTNGASSGPSWKTPSPAYTELLSFSLSTSMMMEFPISSLELSAYSTFAVPRRRSSVSELATRNLFPPAPRVSSSPLTRTTGSSSGPICSLSPSMTMARVAPSPRVRVVASAYKTSAPPASVTRIWLSLAKK